MSETEAPTDPESNDPIPTEAMDEDQLNDLIADIGRLAPDATAELARLAAECRRARAAEARLFAGSLDASSQSEALAQDIAQVALDTAEWLKTLWNVGYMGAGHFPAEPRSNFPSVEVEDILGSALLSRIRQGKRPLPFPPPTRQGVPWHEVVEEPGPFVVDASLVRDDEGRPIGAAIEGCLDWELVPGSAESAAQRVQHRGKGPLYRLEIGAEGAVLHREEPNWTRRIVVETRGGMTHYRLEWPQDDGKLRKIALRAGTWERAEAEASYWIAGNHPEMYGQVRFERSAP